MHRSDNASNYRNHMAIQMFRLSRYPSFQSCAYVLDKLNALKLVRRPRSMNFEKESNKKIDC